MPAYSSDMWNNKSASSTQDSYHSFTRGTSTALLGQLHARGMNSKTLLTLFLTSTQHFNSHQLLPKWNYHFSISTCAFLKIEFKPLFHKETDTLSYLHFSSFHPDHCKRAIPYSQFLPLRGLCSDDDDFLVKSREMMIFCTQRGYPLTSLKQDLRRVTTIGRPDVLTGSERGDTTVDRVPLVITYHLFNIYIKQNLLQNFRILSTDQQTRDIFPQPPVVAYKRDLSLRDILVHSTDSSSTKQPGSLACQRPRCQTCEFINLLTDIGGPKSTFTIRDHFTYMSENLVYCISCRRCSHIYIGETGRGLRSRIGEHLRSVRNNTPGYPVAQHFNSAGHSITDVQVRGMRLCWGSNIVRKQLEMRLIFQPGTVQPDGLNIDFKYVWTVRALLFMRTHFLLA